MNFQLRRDHISHQRKRSSSMQFIFRSTKHIAETGLQLEFLFFSTSPSSPSTPQSSCSPPSCPSPRWPPSPPHSAPSRQYTRSASPWLDHRPWSTRPDSGSVRLRNSILHQPSLSTLPEQYNSKQKHPLTLKETTEWNCNHFHTHQP